MQTSFKYKGRTVETPQSYELDWNGMHRVYGLVIDSYSFGSTCESKSEQRNFAKHWIDAFESEAACAAKIKQLIDAEQEVSGPREDK